MPAILKLLGWRGIAGLAVALVLGAMLAAAKIDARHWKKQSGQFEQLWRTELAAHAQTVANYRAAAEHARAADAANKARVETEQRSISERTAHDYEARIAAARAAAERLRRPAPAAAHPGGSGSAPVPGLSAPAGGAAQAPGQAGLPADDALTATEQAIQLDELIKWVKRQAGVDVNK